MKVTIPEHLKGKELFKFLIENKSGLIATKKAAIKYADPVVHGASIITPVKTGASKALGEEPEAVPGMGSLDVKVVANTAWFCDSHMDVLTDKSYNKSVKEKGALIPHIEDHIHRSTSHVGDVKRVYTMAISLKELGLNLPGTTTVLVFETTVREDYNPKTYKFYKLGKINQHSIGLIYESLGLCINDKDYLPEFELWNKYYDKVINKELIDERGYFWIVPEIRIMENSCVLFGANELTPTLPSDVKTDTPDEPSGSDTPDEPSDKSTNIELSVNNLFSFN